MMRSENTSTEVCQTWRILTSNSFNYIEEDETDNGKHSAVRKAKSYRIRVLRVSFDEQEEMGKCFSKYDLTSGDDNIDVPVDECFDYMRNGTRALKVNHSETMLKKGKLKRKTIILDEDKKGFRYYPTRKGINYKIPISSIIDLHYDDLLGEDEAIKSHAKNLQFVVKYKEEIELDSNDENEHLMVWIMYSENVRNIWIKGLEALMKTKTEKELDPFLHVPWLEEAFLKVDKDNNGGLTLTETMCLLKNLNINYPEEEVEKLFKDSNIEGNETITNGKLTKKEFAIFFNFFLQNEEMQALFDRYGKESWNAEQFRKFLINEQTVDVLQEEAKIIMESIELFKQEKKFTFQVFLQYIFSSANGILNSSHQSACQDMSQPMSHYFINSSHNTYLTSDQLKGASSVDAYINALKKGCKCVEIDCWDGANDEPVIYHGHTWTSKILFKDVIQAISEYAFCVSDYPLILSFENHCSVNQQVKMSDYLKQYLGDRLYIEDIDPELTHLPSPEALKGKIICKGKKLGAFDLLHSQLSDDDLCVTDEDEATNTIEEAKSNIKILEKHSLNTTDFASPVESPEHVDGKKKKKKKIKLAPEFSALVNYIQSVHFKGVHEVLDSQEYYKMSSIGESKFAELCKTSPLLLCELHKKILTRTYPAARRVDSSNYNPLVGWAVGCQIVALNFQTDGIMMDLYNSMFTLNGRSGYVLKPDFMINDDVTYNSEVSSDNDKDKDIQPTSINLKIISGFLLPKTTLTRSSIPDPYVCIDIYGVKEDTCVNKFSTKQINNNGFNPTWNESFQFKLTVPDIAFIRFSIYDKDVGIDDFIGQYTIPYMGMNTGYRSMKLLDFSGNEIPYASLLVHIKEL